MDKDRKLRNINKNCKLIFKTNKKLIRFLDKIQNFNDNISRKILAR